jgi:hypothetical protein
LAERLTKLNIGFTPGLIRVKAFGIPQEGISIDDLPVFFRIFLEDPSKFGWEDYYQQSFLERINRWQVEQRFVLNWQENESSWFYIDGQGYHFIDQDEFSEPRRTFTPWFTASTSLTPMRTARTLTQAGQAVEAKKHYRRLAEGTWQPRFRGLQAQARWEVEKR